MKFSVYCDETLPDLFTSEHPGARYLMIGTLWLPDELRNTAKSKIADLRAKHSIHGEIKWRKISPASEAFYLALIELFMSFGSEMRFRCIAVDRNEVNLGLLNGDAELGFYKFYYQAIHHWILDNNEYRVFCDLKLNRDRTRLATLKTVLGHANRTSKIASVQSLPSSEVVFLQLCDVLLGAASSRINDKALQGAAKKAVVEHLERLLNVERLAPTPRGENKFNVFKIRLQGGW